jgi:sigma-70-like protein
MQELPEDQRAALILSELGDLSHAEVAQVIDCEVGKVKSLVFQARSGLMERRQARETPCQEIREQLATLRGGSLRRGPLRRHLKACPGCAEFRVEVRRQRQAVAAVLPVVPTLALRDNALAAVGISASTAGGGVLAGGGAGAVIAAKTGVAKVAVIAAATTTTVGGAVAIEQTVGGGDSHRGGDAQSESAGASVSGAERAGEVARDGSANGGDGPADPQTTSDGRAYGKDGVSDAHSQGFDPVQGKSNGEHAKEFADGRGQGQQIAAEKRQVAHGGSNPKAGSAPGKPETTGKPETPQNDKPKPDAKSELLPVVPAIPDLTPPERGAKADRDDTDAQP